MSNLQRFIDAQDRDYPVALAEMRSGRKRSHWIWYIFPQITGLGFSEMSKRYAIQSLDEATQYLHHPLLGPRLITLCNVLLDLPGRNATEIMGSPDDIKLRSSMTLFAMVPDADPVFEAVLDKFFNGEKDPATLQIINNSCG
jgi:uncharacterized protein (DUF1810 family)